MSNLYSQTAVGLQVWHNWKHLFHCFFYFVYSYLFAYILISRHINIMPCILFPLLSTSQTVLNFAKYSCIILFIDVVLALSIKYNKYSTHIHQSHIAILNFYATGGKFVHTSESAILSAPITWINIALIMLLINSVVPIVITANFMLFNRMSPW